MYSSLCWKAFDRLFTNLDRFGWFRPFKWDSARRRLEPNDKSNLPLWLLTNSLLTISCILIPIYLFLEHVFIPDSRMHLNRGITVTNTVVLSFTMAGAIHTLSMFVQGYKNCHDLCNAFNTIVPLLEYLEENSSNAVIATKTIQKNTPDLIGISLNLYIIGFGTVPLGSFIVVYLELDSMALMLPKDIRGGALVILLRNVLWFILFMEMISNACSMHLSLISLILHCKRAILKLRFYKKPKPKANEKNAKSKVFNRLGDTELYSLLSCCFKILRQCTDDLMPYILATGLAIDTIANFAVIKLYEDIPLYLYYYAVLFAVIAPCVIMAIVPQAGYVDTFSGELINYWKKEMKRERRNIRKTERYKKLRSLRQISIWVGPFFSYKRSTILTYGEAISNYTVNSTLSF